MVARGQWIGKQTAPKGHKAMFGVIEMFCICFTGSYMTVTFVKTHKIVHLEQMHFIICLSISIKLPPKCKASAFVLYENKKDAMNQGWRSANFCKGSDCKYVSFCRPYSL